MTTKRPETPSVFYRCVESNPPTEHDFLSNAALGRQMRPPITPTRACMWEGISVYDYLAVAQTRAAGFPRPLGWVAVLHIPPDAPILVEKTMRDPHHFTVWGTAQDIQ